MPPRYTPLLPPLPVGLGHVGDIEFDMKLKVTEPRGGHDIASAHRHDAVGHGPTRRGLAITAHPSGERLAVE